MYKRCTKHAETLLMMMMMHLKFLKTVFFPSFVHIVDVYFSIFNSTAKAATSNMEMQFIRHAAS